MGHLIARCSTIAVDSSLVISADAGMTNESVSSSPVSSHVVINRRLFRKIGMILDAFYGSSFTYSSKKPNNARLIPGASQSWADARNLS